MESIAETSKPTDLEGPSSLHDALVRQQLSSSLGATVGWALTEIVEAGDHYNWVASLSEPAADMCVKAGLTRIRASLPVSDSILAQWCRVATPHDLERLWARGALPDEARQVILDRHPPAVLDAAAAGDSDGLTRLETLSKSQLNSALYTSWSARQRLVSPSLPPFVARRLAALAELRWLHHLHAAAHRDNAAARIVAGRVRGVHLSPDPVRRAAMFETMWSLAAYRWPEVVRRAVAGWLDAHRHAAGSLRLPDEAAHLGVLHPDWYQLAIDAANDQPASVLPTSAVYGGLSLVGSTLAAALEAHDEARIASWAHVWDAHSPNQWARLTPHQVDLDVIVALPSELLAEVVRRAGTDLLIAVLERRPITDDVSGAAVLDAIGRLGETAVRVHTLLGEPWKALALRHPDYAAGVLRSKIITDADAALDLPASVALAHFGDPVALVDAICAELDHNQHALELLATLPLSDDATLREYCITANVACGAPQ